MCIAIMPPRPYHTANTARSNAKVITLLQSSHCFFYLLWRCYACLHNNVIVKKNGVMFTCGFKREWVKYYKKMPASSVKRMNGYILVDAASSKKKGSDYTSMWVIGLNVDRNRYALDMVRDRLNLKERGDRLFALHRKWSDAGLRIKQVRYERYGLMADIEHLQARMEDEGYRFQITEVGGVTSKADRIKRLLPIFEQGQMWLPENMYVTDWQKTTVDLVKAFIEEEYMAFPVGMHDDMLDALARMEEPDKTLVWPKEYKVSQLDTASSLGLLGATGWLGA